MEAGVSEAILASYSERFITAPAADVTMRKGGYRKIISRRLRNNRRRKTRKYVKRK
jgi:hypothetical protein